MATLLDPSARPSQSGPHEGLVASIDVGFSQNSSAANLITSSVQADSYINSNTLHFNSASGAQTYSLSGTSGGSVASVRAESDTHQDLSHVLSGFQQTGELNSVLQQQPELVRDLSAIASGDVSTDPENLRFQYPVEETTSKPALSRKAPAVYKEQLIGQLHLYLVLLGDLTLLDARRDSFKQDGTIHNKDRFLPIANVARTMRNAVPKNGKVSKDAKECMQECVSEFVSFITSEACDKCAQEKRKTITGDDILFAMATLGFDNYIDPLRLYLQKYREYTRSEKLAPGAAGASRNSSSGVDAMTPGLEQAGTGFSGAAPNTQMSDFSSF